MKKDDPFKNKLKVVSDRCRCGECEACEIEASERYAEKSQEYSDNYYYSDYEGIKW